jgi:putative sterol carrier protein
MTYEEKMEQIRDSLSFQVAMFNPKKAPKKETVFQFILNEPEGEYAFQLVATPGDARLEEGKAEEPVTTIKTDIETWNRIGGGFISGRQAMAEKRFALEGNILKFLFGFNRIFSGRIDWPLPEGLYTGPSHPDEIKNVLVVSASPRRDKGATGLFTERFVRGFVDAGAEVEVLYTSELKINGCAGCFKCWADASMQCIFRDDMDRFWDAFNRADLLVWATPIYVFHAPAGLKAIIDRLFLLLDPHIATGSRGSELHPRKIKKIPYSVLLALAGFSDFESFGPLQQSLRLLESRGGFTMIGELLRPSCMTFLGDQVTKKMTDSLDALEKAAGELVREKRIRKKTKRVFEQQAMDRKRFLCGANYTMEKMQIDKEVPFVRSEMN